LTTPARITIEGLHFVNSSGTFFNAAPAGFDVFLFNSTDWASYTSPTVSLLEGDYNLGITQTGVSGAYENNWIDYIIEETSGPWFLVFDNRPRGGRTPNNGTNVTIAWSDVSWQSVDQNIQALPPGVICGSRTVYSGPAQYAYYAFPETAGTVSASFSTDPACTNATVANLLTQSQLIQFITGASYGITAICTPNTLCQHTITASDVLPMFFVFFSNYTINGCNTTYRIDTAATSGSCTGGASAAPTPLLTPSPTPPIGAPPTPIPPTPAPTPAPTPVPGPVSETAVSRVREGCDCA
jgi:hypothetical protein